MRVFSEKVVYDARSRLEVRGAVGADFELVDSRAGGFEGTVRFR